MSCLNELINTYGLNNVNTLTKYPSILTYHELGDRGVLLPSLTEGKDFDNKTFYVTEKIDGTNSRIVLYNNDYLIGSREDFLYAKGDRIINPNMGIVNTIRSVADNLLTMNTFPELTVFYGEVYGGNVGKSAKEYSSTGKFGFRVFDIVRFNRIEELHDVLSKNIEDISVWRENSGQPFSCVDDLIRVADWYELEMVPYWKNDLPIPNDLNGTYQWLHLFKESNSGIDNKGFSEGVVVRTGDRSLIRKIRFEDYERTKKRGGF